MELLNSGPRKRPHPRLYLISTFALAIVIIIGGTGCQCPLGLELLQEIPLVVVRTDEVSMPSRAYTSFLLKCPMLYNKIECFVSMPSRAYTSFLRYPFKNLGFMRFPEPVFAGIYQNILTTAVFRAC